MYKGDDEVCVCEGVRLLSVCVFGFALLSVSEMFNKGAFYTVSDVFNSLFCSFKIKLMRKCDSNNYLGVDFIPLITFLTWSMSVVLVVSDLYLGIQKLVPNWVYSTS